MSKKAHLRTIRLAALILCVFASPASSGSVEVSWVDLQNIRQHTVANQTTIDFLPALSLLDGKPVTIRGWITPINLGDGTTVTSFLLTGTPGTCPFCLGFGPESFVLVTAAEPVLVDVTTELLLDGRFKITRNDPTGFYYRLQAAHVIGHP